MRDRGSAKGEWSLADTSPVRVPGWCSSGAVVIRISRRKMVGGATLFAALTVVFGGGALAAGSAAEALLFVLLLFGPLTVFFGISAARAQRVLAVDADGLTDLRANGRLAWSEVAEVRLHTFVAAFAVRHALIITPHHPAVLEERWHVSRSPLLRKPRKGSVEVALDWLNVPWSTVVQLIEACSGRPVSGFGRNRTA